MGCGAWGREVPAAGLAALAVARVPRRDAVLEVLRARRGPSHGVMRRLGVTGGFALFSKVYSVTHNGIPRRLPPSTALLRSGPRDAGGQVRRTDAAPGRAGGVVHEVAPRRAVAVVARGEARPERGVPEPSPATQMKKKALYPGF